jgi:hypothetical protein
MVKNKAGRGEAACEHVRSRRQLAVAMEGDEQEASTTSQKKLSQLSPRCVPLWSCSIENRNDRCLREKKCGLCTQSCILLDLTSCAFKRNRTASTRVSQSFFVLRLYWETGLELFIFLYVKIIIKKISFFIYPTESEDSNFLFIKALRGARRTLWEYISS